MKIEIKLDNPKYCNGCPCFVREETSIMPLKKLCNLYGLHFTYIHIKPKYTGHYQFIRPKKCIKENGV